MIIDILKESVFFTRQAQVSDQHVQSSNVPCASFAVYEYYQATII